MPTVKEMILDWDLDFMVKASSLIDSQREIVDKYVKEDLEREGDSAFLDDSEYLCGIGFVTAQKYLASICKVLGMENEKGKAFGVGPKVNSDVFCAELINEVANHWKHADEWDFSNLKKKQKFTFETLKKAGLDVREYGDGYVASNALHKMGLTKFSDLRPVIKEWSDAVQAAFPPHK